jgi:aryl-alcohol dehydrogenase-like predicted oxidoreductase
VITRRRLLEVLGTATLVRRAAGQQSHPSLQHRTLGRTGRWVVPFGLGGQAALQYPASGLDVPDHVVRAVELGVNYLDTANAYGPSQGLYGQAFQRLKLAPGTSGYNAALRDGLYIASKTGQRYAYNAASPNAASAVRELTTSMTTLFGDGKGYIPEGAYLDAFQIHNLTALSQVDQIYEGLDARGGKMPDRIGALAALLDYRDGTNYTGLNPDRRHYIRHIGITGHQSSPVLMYAIRRDTLDILDTMLVAINANDRNYSSHQFNAVPLARAKGMGIIAMKVFSAGGVYTGMQRQPNKSDELILTVGVPGGVPSEDFVRYPLSIPGVSVVIAGIGHIDRERPELDQLASNLAASQLDASSPLERSRIEHDVAERHGTGTNYFQDQQKKIVQPPDPVLERDSSRVLVKWNTALAGPDPIRSYNVFAGEKRIASVPYRPQSTAAPLSLSFAGDVIGDAKVRVEASTDLPPWQL